jgi:UDP-N-acetylmuramoyl-L-alanyl-D-glutamate--2,6-diaminopimelate ligase
MNIVTSGRPLLHVDAPSKIILAPDVTAVTADSRRVVPGALFVALPGYRRHGRFFVADALRRGAVGVVARPEHIPAGVRSVATDQPRLLYGHLAAALHDHPSHSLQVVAVTGTNGKTSTVFLAQELLRRAGVPARAIGTLSPLTETGGLTTPLAEDLQRILARARAERVRVVLLEASSHALVQHRLAGTHITWAVVTSLGRDHLDYHGTEVRYWAAKRRLVKAPASPWFPRPQVGVLLGHEAVVRDPALARHASGRVEVFGQPEGIANIARARPLNRGLRLRLALGERTAVSATVPWPTDALLPSLEAAMAIAVLLGVPEDAVIAALPGLPLPPGRMNVYRLPAGPRVVVDYAHNPAGLAHVLKSVRRRWPKARITAVFGGRGRRDRGKLPLMGEVAARLADRLIVTTDSPYDEDPALLAADILSGARSAGGRGRYIPDRRSAIMAAVFASRPADVVVVTGRGHETVQQIGDAVRHTGSDADWIQSVLGAVPEGTARDGLWDRLRLGPTALRHANRG